MIHAPPKVQTQGSEALVSRLRGIISSVALDCDCRQRVNDAIERFVALEHQRETRRHLLASRQHRTEIAALVDLLAELEEISWQEADRSVFGELAMVFDDIAQHALRGAEDLRRLEQDA